MNRLKLRFALRVAAYGLPYLVLMVMGMLWLQDRGLLLYFLIAASLLSLAQWLGVRWIYSRPVDERPTVSPSNTWPPAGETAWSDVERLAARVEATPPSLSDANEWSEMFYDVFETVARHFHPESKRPVLEVPIDQALRVAELVARDLRQYLQERLGGAEQLTMHHIYHVVQWGPFATRFARHAWNVMRLGRLFWNPAAAI
ncbi:MAG TPA: hypothetical protein VFI31_04110, partial [Pirellulales bacterium]|nr:hypothetical protein [Pirellulales bacterium]